LTELAVASDGTMYLTVRGRNPRKFAGRRMFVGYALHRREVAELGAELVVRHVLGGESLAELARDLGLTTSGVHWRLARARRRWGERLR
jgi:hypothetical protein